MQVNANGIPVDIPRLRKKVTNIQTPKILHNDFLKFNRFATMLGYENGCSVTAVVPVAHPDYKVLKKQGFRILEVWDKCEIEEETA